MTARFFAPEADAPGKEIALPAGEAEHLTRVLRLKPGEAIRVFNGRGLELDGVVTRATKSDVRVALGEAQDAAPEAVATVTLVQAVLKGDKMDDVVRDAVMMGAGGVQPVVTARTEVTLAALARGRRRERWERVALSSVKQCGRAVVPHIAPPLTLEQWSGDSGEAGVRLMLVEPHAAAAAVPVRQLDPAPPRRAAVLVGPEGGWAPEEIAAAAGRFQLVTLGPRTLRADAMAIVALSALFTRWGEF